ncbi:MAG: ribosomal protein L7/L12 [Kofleriaceae bacterium]
MTDDELHVSFLESIVKNPDDDDARAVYADWLEQRGDPRGEYLRLESQLNLIPPRLAVLQADIAPSWLDAVGRHYDVELVAFGANKINVIKTVRMVTGLGLKDAKDLVESADPMRPAKVVTDVARKAAEQIAREFVGTGAEVQLVSHGRNIAIVLEYRFDVVLVGGIDLGRDKLLAIKALRTVTELGLKDAKDIVERNARHVIAQNVDETRANAIAAAFSGLAEIAIERRS